MYEHQCVCEKGVYLAVLGHYTSLEGRIRASRPWENRLKWWWGSKERFMYGDGVPTTPKKGGRP